METINVSKKIKDHFEQERFKLRMKERRNIFQDEFIEILLNNLNKKEEDIK